MTDPKVTLRGSFTEAAEADLDVIASLRAQGADLTQAREFLAFLFFRSSIQAEAAAEALATEGFSGSIGSNPQGDSWLVKVRSHLVVDTKTIGGLSARLERIAAAHGGRYDGWEAAARP